MINFVLICHKGELEYQALFLVWSLRKHIIGEYIINVAIPNKKSLAPTLQTITTFTNSNCKVYHFENPYLERHGRNLEGDKCSNKIFALKALTNKGTTIFLDSDIIAIQKFNINALSNFSTIVAKPVNRRHAINWKQLYVHLGLAEPKNTIKTSIDNKEIPPYFNSGVLIFPSPVFALIINAWEDIYLKLSEIKLLNKKYYPVFFRDQVAFALAILQLDLIFELLDEQYNFPIRGKKLPTKKLPFLVHYHRAVSIASYKALRKLHSQFSDEHAWTKQNMPNDWKFFFNSNPFIRTYRVFIEKLKYKKYLITSTLKNPRYTAAGNQLH